MPIPIAAIYAIAAGVSALSTAANTMVNVDQHRRINKNKAMAAKNRGDIVRYDKIRKRYYTYK